MELIDLKLVILTQGNVSEINRDHGVIAITSRDIAYEHLTPDDMVLVDPEGPLWNQGSFHPSTWASIWRCTTIPRI